MKQLNSGKGACPENIALKIVSVFWADENLTGCALLRTIDDQTEVRLTLTCPEDFDAYQMERVAGVTLSFDDLEGKDYFVSRLPQMKTRLLSWERCEEDQP